MLVRRHSESWWAALAIAGVLAATAVALLLGRAVPDATVAAWLYLPLVLIVTLRWGRTAGVLGALLADVLVLIFAAEPVGKLSANDASDYVALAAGTVGMLTIAVLVSYLNDRLVRAEGLQSAAAERAQAQQRFQALIEHSADGIQLLDREGRRLYVSPSLNRILGYSPAELQELPLWAINSPEDRESAAQTFGDIVLHPGASVILRLPARHIDGSRRWLENTLTNLLDEPSVRAVVMNIRDVTATQEAEEQERSARDQLATILASVSDAIMVQEAGGKLLYVNDEAARLCGQPSAAAMLALPVSEIVNSFVILGEDEQPLPREQLPAQRVFAGEDRAEVVIGARNTPDDETRWSLVTANGLDDPRSGSRLAVSVFRDITERHRLEAAQQEAIRMRDQFLSTASHELRTPLTTLRGQIDLSLRWLNRDVPREQRLEGLQVASRQIDRLNHLIDDLLDVSRLTTGRMPLDPIPLRLPELVGHVLQAEAVIEPERKIIVSSANDDLWVAADPMRLEQVLTNLLQNARQYSPAGSPITITTLGDPGSVIVSVRDEGIGIPAAEQEQIFKAFHRAGNVEHGVPGLGLGLAIAYELVCQHHGELTVQSEPGEGSTFTLTLPRISPNDFASEVAEHG